MSGTQFWENKNKHTHAFTDRENTICPSTISWLGHKRQRHKKESVDKIPYIAKKSLKILHCLEQTYSRPIQECVPSNSYQMLHKFSSFYKCNLFMCRPGKGCLTP